MAFLRPAAVAPALAAGLCLAALDARAQAVVAVFSSETGPYREALAGLQQELDAAVPAFFLSQGEPGLPASARVVVAFGAKAALRNYPKAAMLVYAMAPGAERASPGAVEVCMEPATGALIAHLLELQPGLRSLGILRGLPGLKTYVEALREAGKPLGVEVKEAFLKDSSEIPERLRGLYGRIDAVWVPPDPILLNAEGLPVFLAFSRSNRVPLYVPTAGLVEHGAVASVGPSFREIGRTAGAAARALLEGRSVEQKLYPAAVEVVIGRGAAARAGLELSEALLRKSDKVIP